MAVTGGTFTNSYIGANQFAGLYGSSAPHLVFTDTSCDLTGTTFAQALVSNIDRALADFETAGSPTYNVLHTLPDRMRIGSNGGPPGIYYISAISSVTLTVKNQLVRFGNQTRSQPVVATAAASASAGVFQPSV